MKLRDLLTDLKYVMTEAEWIKFCKELVKELPEWEAEQ